MNEGIMKEELTREEVAALANCNGVNCPDCKTCQAIKICDSTSEAICKWLAEQLLEEMDKPKVWDGAPEWANSARVRWFKPDYPVGIDETFSKLYTRELPKTRARQIAEEVISENVGGVEDKVSLLTDLIESALEKYAAELKGKE